MRERQLVIEAGNADKNYWKDLWNYRELFYILSWRDIKVRYKQTTVGAAWAIIRPLLTMLIFAFIFGKVAKFSKPGGSPYILIVFAGLLPWQFFANTLGEASNSLLSNSNLISKVYFPRMIIPGAALITCMVDFAITFVILAFLVIFYGYVPPITVLCLPIYIFLLILASFGISLYVTALNVKYRDFRYVIPFIIQFGIYISPVGFTTGRIVEKVGEGWRDYLYLNPMVGIIDGFRWCIVGDQLYIRGQMISIAIVLLFCWVGVSYFRRTEKSFADNI